MTMYAPKYCSREAAFYTIIASIVVLVAWMFVPAVRILPHVIYAEWIVCSGMFLGISALSHNSIQVEDMEMEKEKAVTAPAQH